MVFKISRLRLISALELCCKVTGKNKAMPVLSNVRISVNNSYAELEAASAETSVKCQLPVSDCDMDGVLFADASTLLKYAKLTGCEILCIEVNDKEMNVIHNRGRMTIALSDGKGWPSSMFDSKENAETFSLPSSIAKKVIAFAPSFVSNDSFHPNLMAAHIGFNNGMACFDATDTRKLIHEEVGVSSTIEQDILVPQDIVLMIPSNCDVIVLTSTENSLVWDFGEVQICHAKVKGRYPDVNRVIPKNFITEITFDKAEMVSAIRRVSSLISDTVVVKLAFSGMMCDIESIDLDLQKSLRESVPCQSPSDIKIGVSGRFFLDCLSAIQDDNVRILYSGQNAPIVFKSESNPSLTILLMPMNLPS